MIHTILDACQYVLETQGGPQSPYWLSSIMDEMRIWKASEQKIRAALDKDIAKVGNLPRICAGGRMGRIAVTTGESQRRNGSAETVGLAVSTSSL
ncbi:MAG: hypothetical protein RBS80_26930 [Thermoguttaceae bacterium]|jgi:hypothetical protein|nr:hypothetical protein [Thermoguttaceae bacterium]